MLSPVENVQYYVILSTKVTVQHQTPRGDIEEGTQTFREQVTGKTEIGDSRAQNNSIGDVLTTQETDKGDNGYRTSIAEFETLRTDSGKIPTSEEDNSIKAPAGGYSTFYGDGSTTVNRDSSA